MAAKLKFNTISSDSKDSVEKNIRFTTTSIINIILLTLLFVLVFGFKQSRDMISSGVEYIEYEPIVTTSLMVLLSLSFYICSRAANIWRQRKNPIKIELAANHKDHLLLSVFYLAPMILSLVFIFYSFFDRVYSDIFSWWFFSPISLMITAGYTYFFYRSVFLQNMEVESDISFINQLQNTYSERIKAYFIALMLTTAFLVTFYAGNFVDFKGLIGIAVLDITILYLISLRILFALIFWLFSFTPTLGETISAYKTLVLNIKQKGKQPFKNTLNRIQLVSSLFLCLLFLLVFINFKWTNRGYKKVIELELEAVKGDIERMPVSTYIAKWLDDKSREKENIYLVAGQGGGSRAGFWTGSALLTLDTITNHEFRNNCLAISTVSGSSLGAGIYLNNKSKLEVDDLSGFYNKDFISISLIDLLFIDPWQRILGAKAKYLFWLKNEKNRNEKLIKQEQQYLDEKKLESLWYYENFDIVNKTTDVSYKNGPLFIPNTYDIKNKVKSVISPVDFNENFIHNDLLDSLLTRKNVAPKTISNGQAINLSQMFPFFSQSASIDSTFQFFDGGVYDNSGLSTIRDIYSILSPLRDKYAKERKIFVVYLKNGIETKNEISYSNIGAVSKASMGSIFSAATKRQFKKLDAALNSNGDTLITDFKNERVHVNLNRWLSKKNTKAMSKSIIAIGNDLKVRNVFKDSKRGILPIPFVLNAYFEVKDSTLSAIDMGKIENLFSGIMPDSIYLKGYTDYRGEVSDNVQLASSRCNMVKKLICKVFEDNPEYCDDRIKIVPLMNPEITGKNPFDMQHNRRVEIEYKFYNKSSRYFPPPLASI